MATCVEPPDLMGQKLWWVEVEFSRSDSAGRPLETVKVTYRGVSLPHPRFSKRLEAVRADSAEPSQ